MKKILKKSNLSKSKILTEERLKHKDYWARYFSKVVSERLHTGEFRILHEANCEYFLDKSKACDCSLSEIPLIINPPTKETEDKNNG